VELGLIELVDSQESSSAWPAFLIVMPYQPEPYFTHTDGGPGSWEEVVVDGLVPYIDANYRTEAGPRQRALLGISRGGVWALEIGLRNPQVFNTVGALSPALIVNHPRASYDPFWILQHAEALPGQLWLSTGDSEPSFRLGVDQFATALEQRGIRFTYYAYEGRHEDLAWATILTPVIEFVISSWQADGS
jgi:enterochelin esterase-like enzyme